MKHINFAILGNDDIAKEFGKKGTTSDISIFDRKNIDTIYTWNCPINFPEKIQVLFQVLNMTEYTILNISQIDKYLGEQIIALDILEKKEGIIIHAYEIDREKIKSIIKGTSIENFEFVDNLEELKNKMFTVNEKNSDSEELEIHIDHAFDVKGVGTVILGLIKKGSIKVYDQVNIFPIKKNITIKSIQIHDDPVEEAKSPSRVGLALKGISYQDISRGDIICSNNTTLDIADKETETKIEFTKNKFFKGEISSNQIYMISVGLQIKPIKLRLDNNNNNNGMIMSEKSFAYRKGQTCIILKPDDQNNRIIGKGVFI